MEKGLWQGSGERILAAATMTGLLVAVPASAGFVRLTNQDAASCHVASPSPNADASLVAFESTCDIVGENPDENREIFQVDRNGNVTQLTDTTGCVNAHPASNASGTSVVFDTDCDLGNNPDGNVEIAAYQAGVVFQLTDTAFCDNLYPATNAAGDVIHFDSDCDITGSNVDGGVELFRTVPLGATTQVTDDRSASGCASMSAASDASGVTIVFESDCDLVGVNPEQVDEILRHQGGAITPVTMSFDEPCANTNPALSASGATVAFSSDCDPLGANPEGVTQIFLADKTGGLQQLTEDMAAIDCENVRPTVVEREGGEVRVIYAGSCDSTGENPDRSFEIFRASGGAVSQITDSEGCWSVSPKAAEAVDAFVFVSTCDLDGLGGAGKAQVFLSDVCSCGAPRSRGDPTATDALFALQAAVGAKACAPCECDVSGDGSVNASDALRILNASIGLALPFDCP